MKGIEVSTIVGIVLAVLALAILWFIVSDAVPLAKQLAESATSRIVQTVCSRVFGWAVFLAQLGGLCK